MKKLTSTILVGLLFISLFAGGVAADHEEWDDDNGDWEDDNSVESEYENATKLGYGFAANNSNLNFTVVNSENGTYEVEVTQTSPTKVFLNTSNETVELFLDDVKVYVEDHGTIETDDIDDEEDVVAFLVDENYTLYVTDKDHLDDSFFDHKFNETNYEDITYDDDIEWENETKEGKWNNSLRINETHTNNTTVTLENKSSENVTFVIDSDNNESADFYLKRSVVLNDFPTDSLDAVNLTIDGNDFPFYQATKNGTEWIAFEIPHFSTRRATFSYSATGSAGGGMTTGTLLGLPTLLGSFSGVPYWVIGVGIGIIALAGGYVYYRKQQEMHLPV